MSTQPTKDNSFFYYFSITLAVTVFFAFSTYSIVGKAHFNSWWPFITIHAISVFLWYVLLVYQTKLIGIKNLKTHKKLGVMSVALAVILIISGITISITNYQVTKIANEVFANFTFIILFGSFYVLAFKYRFKINVHKRFMLFASIAMLPPALSRITRILNLNEEMMAAPTMILFLLVLPIYDYRKNKKVHRITIIGTLSIILVLSVVMPIGNSSTWINFVKFILGS